MSSSKAKAEEEDLDDLDDVLEQFTTPQLTKSAPVAPSTAPPVPAKSTPPESDDPLTEEFAKRLASEMEAMMRGLNDGMSPSPGEGPSKDPEVEEGGSKRDAKVQLTPDDNDPFQKAIRQAMEKLQESDDTLKTDSQGGQDTLESLLSSLGDLNLGDNDTEGGENIESMLETMMSQLMSKEILYEPLKELDTKYPEYLSKNSSTLSPEDLSRYADQKIRVSQIVALFENPSYSDDNAAQSADVLRLMNEMQSYGSPPSEIMGAMPPGFDLGTDGLPNIAEGCVIA